MRYDILGVPQDKYKNGTTARIVICVAVFVVAVILNILLTVFRTDSTHIAFLILNILADAFALCFIYFYVSCSILPRRKLYKLFLRPVVKLSGEVVGVSETVQTVNGFECFELTLKTYNLRRVFIVKCGAIPHEISGKVKLGLADNIVISAEVQP